MSEYEGISREGLIDMLEEATDTLAALRAENAALKEAVRDAIRVICEEAESVKDNSGECEQFNVSLFTASLNLFDCAKKLTLSIAGVK